MNNKENIHLYFTASLRKFAEKAPLAKLFTMLPYNDFNETPKTPAVLLTDVKTFTKSAKKIAGMKTKVRAVVLVTGKNVPPALIKNGAVHAVVTSTNAYAITKAICTARDTLLLTSSRDDLSYSLSRISTDLKELNQIGIALSAENDLNKLLNLILAKSKDLTSADAGSLYLIEESDGSSHLRFKLSHNDSSKAKYTEFTMPINKKSIAGYVAITGETLVIDDVYEIPADREYQFNRSIDESTNYRTMSMLVVPMMNKLGKIIGVIQLMNRKRSRKTILRDKKDYAREVQPFGRESVDLIQSLASQATVAIENARLYENLHNVFDYFVRASVTAIESRDPTTSGHSHRVAEYSVALAKAVGDYNRGVYAKIYFTESQLRELRYASLLHDFGKVGVRENVLTKANKLYPSEFEVLRQRFNYLRCMLERNMYKKKTQVLISMPDGAERSRMMELFEKEYEDELTKVKRYFEAIQTANIPQVLGTPVAEALHEIAGYHYHDHDGCDCQLLMNNELIALSVERGSLTEAERHEIETHVTHTYKFLTQIPWTEDLRFIPEYAYKHHEKLNGSGYPNRLAATDIPVQSRIMAIADIYDALTARDRPYKKAVAIDHSMKILAEEAESGKLDAELYDIFQKEEVFKLISKLV